MLDDTSAPLDKQPSRKARARRLTAEISRVLAPGGQVFMKEILPNDRPHSSREEVRRERFQLGSNVARFLAQHGLKNVVAELPFQSHSLNFLYDPNHQPSGEYCSPDSGTFMVYGRKPLSTTYSVSANGDTIY